LNHTSTSNNFAHRPLSLMLGLFSLPTGFASVPSGGTCSPTADPPIPGVMQGVDGKAHILLGMYTDYPPYVSLKQESSYEPPKLCGFNKKVGALAESVCDIKIDFILAPWTECWTAPAWGKTANNTSPPVAEYIGKALYEGRVHGCTGYTHSKGERGLSLEFTHSILAKDKTAGILTRLDNDGKPFISPTTVDFTPYKLGDVSGWAPTADTFWYNQNHCVDGSPGFTTNNTIMFPNDGDGNEAAINALKSGELDALYIYADQLHNFIASGNEAAVGFGEKTTATVQGFAYIQTGLNGWSINGTTLAISKLGSGLSQILNPCIDKIVRTSEYLEICESYFDSSSCIGGAGQSDSQSLYYDAPMNERTDAEHTSEAPNKCENGYCTCSE